MPPEPPTYAKAGETDGWPRLRVIDTATGQAIRRVIEADVKAGWLMRGLEDESGKLIRNGAVAATLREQRPIRLEWKDA